MSVDHDKNVAIVTSNNGQQSWVSVLDYKTVSANYYKCVALLFIYFLGVGLFLRETGLLKCICLQRGNRIAIIY